MTTPRQFLEAFLQEKLQSIPTPILVWNPFTRNILEKRCCAGQTIFSYATAKSWIRWSSPMRLPL
jgi:hypothetical protein